MEIVNLKKNIHLIHRSNDIKEGEEVHFCEDTLVEIESR